MCALKNVGGSKISDVPPESSDVFGITTGAATANRQPTAGELVDLSVDFIQLTTHPRYHSSCGVVAV